MIEVRVTREFEERFLELPEQVRRRAAKQERFFRENPFHSSLHTEKLHPKDHEVWSFRVDRKYRVIFRFIDGKTALFLTVGPHDWVYRFRW